MTKKLLPLSLAALSLLLSGCNNTPEPTSSDSASSPDTSDTSGESSATDTSDSSGDTSATDTSETSGDTSSTSEDIKDDFKELSETVIKNHNYTMKVNCTSTVTTTNVFSDFSIFNIDDDVMYDDSRDYFYGGYIKQKDQGIVYFESLKNGSEVIPDYFVSTNTALGMSDVYPLAIENFLKLDVFEKQDDDSYIASSMDAMAIAANLGFSDWVVYVSAPENITITADKNANKIHIEGTFIYNYQDESAGSLDDTFIQEPHLLTIDIKDIGNTHNASFESYVENPTTIYSSPTSWSSNDMSFFNTYFNKDIPPFIAGLSYSYRMGRGVSSGDYVAMLEDYASGDLTASYSEILARYPEYKKSASSNTFTKTVEDEEAKLVHTYTIQLIYTAPSAKQGGIEIGFLFPNGVFTVKFIHKTKTLEEIVNVGLMNEYINASKAKGLLKPFDLTSTYKVSNFVEGTAGANEAYGSDAYALVVPTRTSYFKIYIPTYDEAISFLETYTESMKENGFEPGTTLGSFFFYSLNDKYGSIVTFSDVKNGGASNYPGYIQVNFRIFNESVDEYNKDPVEEVTLERISLSGYTTTYNVNDTFSFDGVVTAHYSDGTSKTVTPTRVQAPDMTTPGTKQVIVYYTEGEVTKLDTYTITVNGTAPVETKYKVSFVAVDENYDLIEGDVFDLDNSVFPNEVAKGERFTFKIALNSNYEFAMWMPSDEIGDVWAQIDEEGTMLFNMTGTLTMPEYDFEIYVQVKEKPSYQINFVNDLDNGLSVEVTMPVSGKAKAGDSVNFKVNNENSIEFELSVKDAYGNLVEFIGPNLFTGIYQFSMPASEVTITIVKKGATPVTLVSLSVVDPKVSYEVGDTFVAPTVKANYSDGSSVEVSGATFNGYDMSTAGTYTVIVSYEGISTRYQITVSEPSGGETLDVSGEYTQSNSYFHSDSYKLTLNKNGTGTFVRNAKSDYPYDGKTVLGVNFTYVVDATTKEITFTFVSFMDGLDLDTQGIQDAFRGNYLFDYGNNNKTNTGTILESGSISIKMYSKTSGTVRTFAK